MQEPEPAIKSYFIYYPLDKTLLVISTDKQRKEQIIRNQEHNIWIVRNKERFMNLGLENERKQYMTESVYNLPEKMPRDAQN